MPPAAPTASKIISSPIVKHSGILAEARLRNDGQISPIERRAGIEP
jgi:hypothetical protein